MALQIEVDRREVVKRTPNSASHLVGTAVGVQAAVGRTTSQPAIVEAAESFLDTPNEIDELLRQISETFAPRVTAMSEENTLVYRSMRGEEDAFAVLYERYSRKVQSYIARRMRHMEDAEDATQQVFLQAWIAIGRFKPQGTPFLAWLYTIARNLVITSYRKKPSLELADDLRDQRAENDPERAAVAHWQGGRLAMAIHRLAPMPKTVVTLRFRDGFSLREIGVLVGKTEVNVRVIQFRALRQLRNILQEAWL